MIIINKLHIAFARVIWDLLCHFCWCLKFSQKNGVYIVPAKSSLLQNNCDHIDVSDDDDEPIQVRPRRRVPSAVSAAQIDEDLVVKGNKILLSLNPAWNIWAKFSIDIHVIG